MRLAPKSTRESAPRPKALQPRPERRELSPGEQADVQESAIAQHYRAKGQHIRGYWLGDVLKFEQVAEVIPITKGAK